MEKLSRGVRLSKLRSESPRVEASREMLQTLEGSEANQFEGIASRGYSEHATGNRRTGIRITVLTLFLTRDVRKSEANRPANRK
jgi:hypothetical protein